MSTKRELRSRIGKLERSLKASEEDTKELRKRLLEYAELEARLNKAAKVNAKLSKLLERVWQKRRRDKARIEQMHYQLDAMAESQLWLRSELFANINAAQLRSAKAGVQISDIERVMPGGGKPTNGPVLVYEDGQEQGRRGKRFGVQ